MIALGTDETVPSLTATGSKSSIFPLPPDASPIAVPVSSTPMSVNDATTSVTNDAPLGTYTDKDSKACSQTPVVNTMESPANARGADQSDMALMIQRDLARKPGERCASTSAPLELLIQGPRFIDSVAHHRAFTMPLEDTRLHH